MRALILTPLIALLGGCVVPDPTGGEPRAPGVDTALGACLEGATQPADDGCNTCTCDAAGQWRCSRLACAEACAPGDTRQVDACLACVCAAGEWRCHETCEAAEPNDGACSPDCDGGGPGGSEGCEAGEVWLAEDGCNTCGCQPDGTVLCTVLPCHGSLGAEAPVGDSGFACETDADCAPSGCGLAVCAADFADACDDADRDPEPCFAAEITTCGCVEGRCAWAPTPALDRCVGGEAP